MNKTELEKLNAKGIQLIDQGNTEEAIRHFHEILQYDDNVYVRNNLALAYYLSEDWNDALLILESVLSDGKDSVEPNPFTFALASMIYSALENELKAINYIKSFIPIVFYSFSQH